jgi:glycosyltransferase involved in cell wall biosynthesis
MIYLTFNDNYSGVFNSQVINTCLFISKEFNVKVKLVSFVSIRLYSAEKVKITRAYKDAIVLPMFPGVKNWKLNFYTLLIFFLFNRRDKVIARGPFATFLAQKMKRYGKVKSVVFDSRGAYSAEFKEYNIVGDKLFQHEVENIEREAVLKSDFRIAVSNKLIAYWEENFLYRKGNEVVIPCTLDSSQIHSIPDETEFIRKRREYGFNEGDVIIVFSGSGSLWHSFGKMAILLKNIMDRNSNIKILFLSESKPDLGSEELNQRVTQKWLQPKDVFSVLSIADYGLLVRENTVTNLVSSPTKYAEYLSAGLKVLISAHVGDYSEFTLINDTGYVIEDLDNNSVELERVPLSERIRINSLCLKKFSKTVYKDQYARLLQH